MYRFFFDASALGKQYAPEIGSQVIEYLFDTVPLGHLVVLTQTIGATLSLLVRRRNGGRITAAAHHAAYLALRNDVILRGEVSLRTTGDRVVFGSLVLIERHSINSTDALVLRSALDVVEALRAAGHDLVLVASDARLVRAAAAEGLVTVNPETDDQARLEALIAAA